MLPRIAIGEAPVLADSALALRLAQSGSCSVLGPYMEGEALLHGVTSEGADLALLDLNTLRGAGPQTVRQLKQAGQPTRVLVLCSDVSRATLRAILLAGADGYVVQVRDFAHLLDVTCAVAAGSSYFSDEIAEAFRETDIEPGQYQVNDPGSWHLEDSSAQKIVAQATTDRGQITQREVEILNMVAVGYSSKLIADRLFISIPTVRKHRENLMRKLGLHNAAAVTAYAIANGLSLPP